MSPEQLPGSQDLNKPEVDFPNPLRASEADQAYRPPELIEGPYSKWSPELIQNRIAQIEQVQKMSEATMKELEELQKELASRQTPEATRKESDLVKGLYSDRYNSRKGIDSLQ